jgi:hypothetical protein
MISPNAGASAPAPGAGAGHDDLVQQAGRDRPGFVSPGPDGSPTLVHRLAWFTPSGGAIPPMFWL